MRIGNRPSERDTIGRTWEAAPSLSDKPDALPAGGAAKKAEADLDDPGSAFAACAALLEAGRAEAGVLVQDLLRRFPNHAEGWEQLGRTLLRSGKPEAALACFRRAHRASPSGPLAMACGRALRQLGRTDEARAAFAEACQRLPAAAPAQFLFGVTAQDARDFEAAAAAYERALACDPGLAEAAVNLGTVLQEMGDLDGAKRAYGRAVRQRPDSFGRVAQALTTAPRGELWLDLGRLRRDLAG
jgi:tetratricopeptide (TPR) repeat protein